MSATALLIMDLQRTIDTARPHMNIIYVMVSFRPGHPEVSPRAGARFLHSKANNLFVAGSPETAIHPSIAPIQGDIIVEKKRISAFTGSGLDVILRGIGIQTLVLAGIATGGVVLSTVCDATDRDFGVVILKDLCLDPDEQVHEVLVEKVFRTRGEVVNAQEWLTTLGS